MRTTVIVPFALALTLLVPYHLKAQLTLNLEAQYDFSGGAIDVSGNGNNGIVHGATLTTDRFDSINSAYNFDGNDYIDLTNSFDYPTRTINIWALAPVVNTNAGHIYDSDNGELANAHTKMMMSENVGVDNLIMATGNAINYQIYVENTWCMMTIVRDPINTNFYVNGLLVGTDTSGAISSGSGYENALLGCDRLFNNSRFFVGKIDDIRIYSRALSLCEIRELYGALPNVVATGPSSICNGDAAELSASGASVYTWGNGAGFDSIVNVSPDTTTTYSVVGVDGFGCQDTAQITITVLPLPDTTVTQMENVLSANNNHSGVSYQWLDCNDNFAPLMGDSSQVYVATSNGSYAIELTENGCVDTSFCHVVNSIEVNEHPIGQKKVFYPNPTRETIHVHMGDEKIIRMEISEINGEMLIVREEIDKYTHIDVSSLKNGVYVIRIMTSNAYYIGKIVKN